MTEPDFPSFVGPHNDRELELMLAGTKPAAFLISEPTVGYVPDDLADFAPHVAAGTIIQEDVPTDDGLAVYHYFCLPTEEWRIKLMKLIRKTLDVPGREGFTLDDLDRLHGHLLGYTKANIEAFIERNKHR